MGLGDQPPAWTRRAWQRGFLFGLLAALVVFSYFAVSNLWVGLLFLDALDLVGAGGDRDGLWSIVGLMALVAVPIYAADKIGRWVAERRRSKGGRRS